MRTVSSLMLVAAFLTATGCADTSTNWPTASDFSRISQKVLTPQEQDQAIKDMSEEQKAAESKARRRIETTR